MGKNIVLEVLPHGGYIGVDLDELKQVMEEVYATKNGMDGKNLSQGQKKQLLSEMGYDKYTEILKKEAEYSWL